MGVLPIFRDPSNCTENRRESAGYSAWLYLTMGKDHAIIQIYNRLYILRREGHRE